jgi:hypothetical protein
LADETFDVVIDKAAMDAMMAKATSGIQSNLYWTKRGLYVNTSRESWFRWSLFCKYPLA